MTLEEMIRDWKGRPPKKAPDDLPLYEAIDAACAKTGNKSQRVFATRINREIDCVTLNNWDDMYTWLLGLAPPGLGPVSVFAVADRLGHALGLPRTSLYLRGDIRLAWNKLHGTRRVPEVDGRVPAELLPEQFQGMTADAIEDMLLFHLHQLKPWLAKSQKSEPPDWLRRARLYLEPKEQERLDRALVIIGDRQIVTSEWVRLIKVTEELVDRFAEAMKTKLLVAQLLYGYYDGWKDTTWHATCLDQFHSHIAKGDPVDVANYCAFMYHHAWPTNGKPGGAGWPGDSAPERGPFDLKEAIARARTALTIPAGSGVILSTDGKLYPCGEIGGWYAGRAAADIGKDRAIELSDDFELREKADGTED